MNTIRKGLEVGKRHFINNCFLWFACFFLHPRFLFQKFELFCSFFFQFDMSSIHTVIVHPIVLLGITDHVKRMSTMTKGRVVGVLLGSCRNGVVDCSTSFAGRERGDGVTVSSF